MGGSGSLRAQLAEGGDGVDLLVVEVRPQDARRALETAALRSGSRSWAGDLKNRLGRHNQVHTKVVLGLRELLVAALQRMHGGRPPGPVPDDARLPGESELEVGE